MLSPRLLAVKGRLGLFPYDAVMRGFAKFLLWLVIVAGLVGGVAWWWAGRGDVPLIEIRQPDKLIGQATPLDVVVSAPGGRFSRVEITVEQNEQAYPVYSLAPAAELPQTEAASDRLFIVRQVGVREVPALQPGPARIVVRAARTVLYGIRELQAEATRDVEVRLEPPRLAVLSTLHYVNHGGVEFVVYRATPADVQSGIRVGNETYPGFPAEGAGISSDPSLKVAFFALLPEQELNTPVTVYARDAAGNEASLPLDHRAFARRFQQSRITIDDRFLDRVVPAIAATTPEMPLSTAPENRLTSFLQINGELRRRDAQTIAEQAAKTSARMSWKDAFQPLGNASIEASFADRRTYFYQGREVDRQVHLGFDLAVTERVPVIAAQRGTVVYADDLGIYGNCVIVDHGLGVQTLYAHLSSMDVQAGAAVEKGQALGRSGMTGLAGGDHLHFTVLLHGRPVNPVEWWDPKWMQDRVFRKITEAAGSPAGM
jgi:murein DD-endopeptidase MepM/ murein hydrolase activator NlpD